MNNGSWRLGFSAVRPASYCHLLQREIPCAQLGMNNGSRWLCFSAVGQVSYCRLLQRNGVREIRIASRSVRNERPLMRCDFWWLGFACISLFGGRTGFLSPLAAERRCSWNQNRFALSKKWVMRCDRGWALHASHFSAVGQASYRRLLQTVLVNTE